MSKISNGHCHIWLKSVTYLHGLKQIQGTPPKLGFPLKLYEIHPRNLQCPSTPLGNKDREVDQQLKPIKVKDPHGCKMNQNDLSKEPRSSLHLHNTIDPLTKNTFWSCKEYKMKEKKPCLIGEIFTSLETILTQVSSR